MGTSQLLSVPFAMYAENSGSSNGYPIGGVEGEVLTIVNGVPTWTDVSEYINSESLAEITTVEANNIDFESMIAGGNIINDGGFTIVSKGVVWSESPDPTPELETKTDEGGGASSFTSLVIGLDDETEYFYRAYATTSLGTAYGSTYTFLTDSSQFYDQDGDGYTPEQGDCDDFDDFTYPGAAYNESTTNCMTDLDGDGYGDIAGINPGTDCNDLDDSVYQGACEILDGIDNNCDGIIDNYNSIAGIYSMTTTYGYHDFLPTYVTNTQEMEIVEIFVGLYSIADFTGGLYSDGPYLGAYNTTATYAEITENCGLISWFGQSDTWGPIIPLEGGENSVDSNGVITISWFCEAYGEFGVSVYTPL
jgi:hypothetical protein